jgi:hypothetical protein
LDKNRVKVASLGCRGFSDRSDKSQYSHFKISDGRQLVISS